LKYKGTIQDYFNIKQSGSIVLFKPETKFAEEWWEENVEESQTIGGAYAVEHRYANDIIEGFTELLQT
jgi:hypothetical protein